MSLLTWHVKPALQVEAAMHTGSLPNRSVTDFQKPPECHIISNNRRIFIFVKKPSLLPLLELVCGSFCRSFLGLHPKTILGLWENLVLSYKFSDSGRFDWGDPDNLSASDNNEQ